ncbi:MAG: metallophosphoesterase [Negativicutes bacterium]|nr:metallophosphoesterase [Negativicutes bacterium]
MKRVVAIADIHGRLGALELLIRDSLKGNFHDYQLVFLGDYIGYGKDSIRTLLKVKEFKERTGAIVLRGNWEEMLLQAFGPNSNEKTDCVMEFYRSGSKDVLQELKKNRFLCSTVLDFIRSMPLFYVGGTVLYAHSGVDLSLWEPGMSAQEFGAANDLNSLIWNQNFWDVVRQPGKELPIDVVVGHLPVQILHGIKQEDPFPGPFLYKRALGIDCGASRKAGYLGAVCITDSVQDAQWNYVPVSN